MENLDTIIATNLIYLRKKAKLTQLEFGEKFNYSDKTVSKWELGSVVPSVETLKEIADFYGVSVDYLLTKHQSAKEYTNAIGKTIDKANKIILIALYSTVLWCIAVTVYVANYLRLNSIDPTINRYWVVFLWAVPATFLLISFFTNKYFKTSLWPLVYLSATVWTILLAAFLTWYKEYNYWFIFFIGVPIQAALVLLMTLKKK